MTTVNPDDHPPLRTEPYRVRPPYDEPEPDDRPIMTQTELAGLRIDRVAALTEPLYDVELGEYEQRILRWLAEWGTGPVAAIANLLHRARLAGYAEQGRER